MHKSNKLFQRKLEVEKSALGIVSMETIAKTPARPTQREINDGDYLPKAAKPAPAKWWTKFLFPRVIGGNYQRKREVFSGFGA